MGDWYAAVFEKVLGENKRTKGGISTGKKRNKQQFFLVTKRDVRISGARKYLQFSRFPYRIPRLRGVRCSPRGDASWHAVGRHGLNMRSYAVTIEVSKCRTLSTKVQRPRWSDRALGRR